MKCRLASIALVLSAVGLTTLACAGDGNGDPQSQNSDEVQAPDLTVRLNILVPIKDADCTSAVDGSLTRLKDEAGKVIAEIQPLEFVERTPTRQDNTYCEYRTTFLNVPDAFEYVATVDGFGGSLRGTPKQLEEGETNWPGGIPWVLGASVDLEPDGSGLFLQTERPLNISFD